MPVSAILAKFLTVVEPAITLASLANGAGRVCTQIDNTTVRATRGKVALKFRTGAVAPTLNALVKLYAVKNTGAGTNIQEGQGPGAAIGAVDAAVATEPSNAELVGTAAVSAATATTYTLVAKFYDPGPAFSFVVWNAIGQALDATAGNFLLQWEPEVDEAQ